MLGQRGTVEAARSAVRLPTPSRSRCRQCGADVAGLSYVTPNDRFYRIDTAIVVPRIDPADWTLTIHGRVGRPIRLTFDDLLKRPMVEVRDPGLCVQRVGGDLIGNAKWLGVPIKSLLDEVEPEAGADQVVSRSVDGFGERRPRCCATAATRCRRGHERRAAAGAARFPVRMVVPGLYGYVSATWLAELRSRPPASPTSTRTGSPAAGRSRLIKTQSRIDRPRSGATVAAGDVVVAGVAWAQHRGIERVEVRVDGEQWHEATLAETASIDTWRLWSWTWPATAGEHTLEVRATDATGEVQTSEIAPPAPDGATGWHAIGVTVD